MKPPQTADPMKAPVFVAIALQFLDWLSTWLGLSAGLAETNPAMRSLVDLADSTGHGVVKVLGAIAIVALAWYGKKWAPRVTEYNLWALNGYMISVVGTNFAAVLGA